MSLWLQAVMEALEYGEYEDFRVNLLPNAPISVPACLFREVEFAERRCRDNSQDRLFPIRFLWLMEAHEQCMFGLSPLERSCYHPEKLLELWKRASTDGDYRQECECAGLLFDFAEKAVKVSAGWIYIGERFVEDFLEVETILGAELLFPDPLTGDGRPAFKEFKQPGSSGESPAEPDAEVGGDDRRH
jgi:hypothetical protein